MDDKRYPSGQLARWFWSGYARKALPLLLLAGIFMVAEGAALGGFSYMVRPMFDSVFTNGDRAAIYFVAFVVFGIFIGRAIAGFCQRILMGMAGRRILVAVQSDMVAHVLTLDSSFFTENSPGKLMERVRGDPNAAVGIVSQTFSAIGRDLTAMVALLFVALTTDWFWTILALAGAPLIVWPVSVLQRVLRAITRKLRIVAGEVSTFLDETFHGIDTVKLNAIEKQEAGRFRVIVQNFARIMIKQIAAQAAFPSLMDIVAGIGFVGVLTLGGLQIINGDKTIGDFMAFFTAIALMFEPMRRLGALTGSWQKALVSMERMYSVFDQQPSITSPSQPAIIPRFPEKADLGFERVSFSYHDAPVLSDVSFTAVAGRTTALVGASGAGKTTVIRLISRLIDPVAGTISLGGTGTRQFDLTDLRRLFSVVTQDTMLFDETIERNITLGAEVSQQQLERVLEASYVSEFLPNLPKGLQSGAGPRGSALSGGQRQRVAIARALLRDTPFLLLDEATSALDTRSEKIVQQALEKLSAGRTSLVIAHRLSTIRNAANIIVMDHGRVVDQGDHDTLLARDGLYAGLYRIQFQTTPIDA